MASDEWFDVVDEADRVVDRLPRDVVHARGLRHRAVHVVVFNARGEVFLQLRSRRKDNHPGVWDSSCSGHVDSGEDYATAAVREMREEIGIAVEPGALREVDVLTPCEVTGQEFIRIHVLRHEGPFVLEPMEIDDGRWWTVAEVDAAVASRPGEFSPAFRWMWERGRARAA